MKKTFDFLTSPYQREYPKWLFICTAGMLRSATAAHHFASKGINTRCAGTDELYAIQPVHENTLMWADKIFCMEKEHKEYLNRKFDCRNLDITVLDIQDDFSYREEKLIQLLEDAINATQSKRA
ncbi:MAG: protein tyrosine phosphatase [Candidatus Berkelbacteria bacterium]|nr:protein tyrosine phosphatase [Candidatus Berkelbacteria bacterium]